MDRADSTRSAIRGQRLHLSECIKRVGVGREHAFGRANGCAAFEDACDDEDFAQRVRGGVQLRSRIHAACADDDSDEESHQLPHGERSGVPQGAQPTGVPALRRCRRNGVQPAGDV